MLHQLHAMDPSDSTVSATPASLLTVNMAADSLWPTYFLSIDGRQERKITIPTIKIDATLLVFVIRNSFWYLPSEMRPDVSAGKSVQSNYRSHMCYLIALAVLPEVLSVER